MATCFEVSFFLYNYACLTSLSTVRDYIKSAFEKCLPAKHELLRKQLNVIIDQAKRTDMIDYIDWTERDLPR
jgi:hypothetical protein